VHVLLSTYDSRGGVQLLVGLAVRLRALGAEVRVCAPPDCAERLAELAAFLDAGTPPVYVGFGSMRAPKNFARVTIEAIRAQGRRALLSRGWAGLALTPQTRARAAAVAGTIRTDGATVAATLLLDAVSRERPPVSA
jgi:UDP:flavonoid glycosyltransferase YjiC (YdhE family)